MQLLQNTSREDTAKICHASEGWHPEIEATTLDASLRWHDSSE